MYDFCSVFRQKGLWLWPILWIIVSGSLIRRCWPSAPSRGRYRASGGMQYTVHKHAHIRTRTRTCAHTYTHTKYSGGMCWVTHTHVHIHTQTVTNKDSKIRFIHSYKRRNIHIFYSNSAVDGGADECRMNRPCGMCHLNDGSLIFADAANNSIRWYGQKYAERARARPQAREQARAREEEGRDRGRKREKYVYRCILKSQLPVKLCYMNWR